MKTSFIIGAAAALLASTGAKAADIVTYQQQPVAAAAPSEVNWNGVYVGGTIGGSWASSDTSLRGTNGMNWVGKGKVPGNPYQSYAMSNGRMTKKSVDADSFIGGIYAGYNFQPTFLSGSFLKDVVLGVETDWNLNSSGGDGHKGFDFPVSERDGSISHYAYGYSAAVRQRWNGATRLRIGYAMGPEKRILPYFAAGVSYADIRAKGSETAPSKGFNGDGVTSMGDSTTKTRAGWNIGGGIDYIPPILNDHIVLRAEYRFTDFGAGRMNSFGYTNPVTANVAGITPQTWAGNQHVKFHQNDFRVGVAYKF